MAYPVFPSVLNSYPTIKTPVFRTRIISYGNKAEQRLAMDSEARNKLQVSYKLLTPADAEAIRRFFIARKGAFEAFWFTDVAEAYGAPARQASTAYSAGDIVRPETANGRSYRCTTAGTSGSGTPTWPTTEGGTVVDGGVTWTENSYLVRFEDDLINLEYFSYQLWNLGELKLIEVAG